MLKAVDNVNNSLAPALVGMEVTDQRQIDQRMLDLDGTHFSVLHQFEIT